MLFKLFFFHDAEQQANARAIARIRFAGFQRLDRLDPFVPALQLAAALSDEDVDALFRAGAAL